MIPESPEDGQRHCCMSTHSSKNGDKIISRYWNTSYKKLTHKSQNTIYSCAWMMVMLNKQNPNSKYQWLTTQKVILAHQNLYACILGEKTKNIKEKKN